MWGWIALGAVAVVTVFLVEHGSLLGGVTSGATWALITNAAPVTSAGNQVQWNNSFPNVLQRQKDMGKPVVLMVASKGVTPAARLSVSAMVVAVDDPTGATKGVAAVTYKGQPAPPSWAPPEGTRIAVNVQDLAGVA